MPDSELISREQNDEKKHGMNRRQLLLGMGAAASLVSGSMALGVAHAEGNHDHSKHKPQHASLLDAVNTCVDKGRRCIAHCLVVFQEGDLKLADCARKVHEMKAVCDAFSYLLTANSEYVKEFSSICSRVCEDCEKECREHDYHVECRECAEACIDVMKAIDSNFA